MKADLFPLIAFVIFRIVYIIKEINLEVYLKGYKGHCAFIF